MRIHKLTRAGFATFAVLVGGLLFGASAALAAGAPSVVGEGVSSITPFEAHLEATVNAGEEATECHFQYGKTSVTEHEVLCEGQLPLAGGEQGVGLTIKGLTSNTTYHYKIVVKNATGKAEGEGEFTTLTAEKPVVESEDASAVQSSTATLEAQVNPNYQKTAYEFEYATNKDLTGAKTAVGASELEGFGTQTASVVLSGLEAGENYYYRVVATNATGSTDGVTPAQSFTTPPTPSTDIPTNITGTGATFNGHFTLTPQDTKYSFDYKIGNECTGENSTPTIDAGTGVDAAAVSWTVPSPENPGVYSSTPPLHPDSEYTVCFLTTSASGTSIGTPVHFVTPPTPPTISSESTTFVSALVAGLRAQIDPNLQETTYLFEYSTKATGETLEGAITKVNGQSPLPAELTELPTSVGIYGLTPNTTYYYRAVAENTTPLTTDGPVQAFLTFPNVPITGKASAITTSTANITGTIDPSSSGQPAGHETTYYFQYGNDEAYGKETPVQSAGEGATPVGETTELTGLKSGWTYHYRIVASNDDNGTPQFAYGPDQTFTTEPGPPTPPSEGEQTPVAPTPIGAAPVGSTFPNLTAVVPLPGPKEAAAAAGTETKSLTRAQKLAKALKACRKAKGKQRASCEKQAHRKYGPKPSKGKRGKS
jgi:hypothetical protein